jgi:hypothetical protein
LNPSDNADVSLDPRQRQTAVRYPAPYGQLCSALCRSALRDIRILSPQLDPLVFDNSDLADALSAHARKDSHSRVRILIADSRKIVQQGHRLLNLARRLPSSVYIRKLEHHPEMTGETFVSRDRDGIAYYPGDDSPGFYDPDSRASAQGFIDKFETLWERAVEDPQFRRLGL